MAWLSYARKLADAAERARNEGDVASSLVLATAAAQALQVHRALVGSDARLPSVPDVEIIES